MTISPPSSEAELQQVYNRGFYANQIEGSARSAAAVVPRILSLFPWIRSVVDVGCGTGVWLHQFRLLGVGRVLGLDVGDPVGELLQIEPQDFRRVDLSEAFKQAEHFDLAMSLEVAEHLPPVSAGCFVSSLTRLSDLIVFGAAIPGQGGTQHLHERWPSYWVAHFEAHGFVCFDVLRGELWYDERVEWWYRQNILVFVKSERTDLVAQLQAKAAACRMPVDVVHPVCFEIYRTTAELVNSGQLEQAAMTASQRADLAALAARIEAIQSSTSWRVVSLLQRLLHPYPRLRTFIRRSAKLAWWTVTLRLPAKLRERIRARSRKS